MFFYEVKRPLFISPGTVLALSPEQASRRYYGVEPTASGFKATRELCFKAGERIGFETVPKRLLPQLQAIEETGDQNASFSAPNGPAVPAHPPARSRPAGLSALEQVAWQSALQEGRLTLHTYQTLCRGQSRRSLQSALTGMVAKQVLVREGATHQVVYRLAQDQ